jgi:hypothetical protein
MTSIIAEVLGNQGARNRRTTTSIPPAKHPVVVPVT